MINYTGGVRSTKLNFQDMPIGGRPCIPDLQDFNHSYHLENFIEMLDLLFTLFVKLPIMGVYLLHRIGIRNTIKLFKRVDREVKRKESQILY